MEESLPIRLILIIEDNPEHAHQIESSLNQNTGQYQTVVIPDGKQAMNFLRRRGGFEEASRPDLILLDLNLPSKHGQEILAEIKADSQLRRIPIVVLTLSTSEEEVLKTYTLQGNCYVIKSHDLEQLSQTVKRIEEFWLGIVTLPAE